MMPKLIFAAVFVLLFTKTQAQQNTVSVSFQMSLPLGDYKNTYSKTGTGLLFSFLHPLSSHPSIGIGAETGFLQINAESERYKGSYMNEYHTYIVSASNYIFTVAPKLSINLLTLKKTGKFYIDCSIGTNIFFSYTAISHDYDPTVLTSIIGNDVVPSSKTDSSSAGTYWAFRCGIGTGLAMPVGKKNKKYLLLRCCYVYGGRAGYFSDPTINQFQISLAPKASKTCMLLAELGLRFSLTGKKNKS